METLYVKKKKKKEGKKTYFSAGGEHICSIFSFTEPCLYLL